MRTKVGIERERAARLRLRSACRHLGSCWLELPRALGAMALVHRDDCVLDTLEATFAIRIYIHVAFAHLALGVLALKTRALRRLHGLFAATFRGVFSLFMASFSPNAGPSY